MTTADHAETTVEVETDADATLQRLHSQLDYYERAAGRSQRNFRVTKIAQLVVAAAVPVAAAGHAGAVFTAILGALILILEGVQALFGWQQNWVNYRNNAEALQSEQHLFQAGAGPYAGAPAPKQLLAERVEGLLSSERSGWVQRQLPPGKGGAEGN
ncbi:MAG TPA: DUF4231 domain-containing protein [Solirubrobacter sp.]